MEKIKSKKEKRCKFGIGFNGLGMPIFFCLTHGKVNSKYKRAKEKCYLKLAVRIKKLINKSDENGRPTKTIS